jgi:hypothetical protein
MIVKFKGSGYSEGFIVTLTRTGGIGGVVDVIPVAGTYAGDGTLYPQTVSMLNVNLNGEEFEIIDDAYEDRFSLLCRVENPLSGNSKYIFRDHKEHFIFMIDGFNLPSEMINNITGGINVGYDHITDVSGEMTVTESSSSRSILRNVGTSNSLGFTVQKYIDDIGIDGGGLSANTFISLGSTDDILGQDTTVRVTTLVGNKPIHTGERKCANMLIMLDF